MKAALYILVPAAYLSMVFWRPAGACGPVGHKEISLPLAMLMAAVFLVSLLSWGKHRVVSSLGFIACILWLAVVLLPVL
jgi:hypothetical protein